MSIGVAGSICIPSIYLYIFRSHWQAPQSSIALFLRLFLQVSRIVCHFYQPTVFFWRFLICTFSDYTYKHLNRQLLFTRAYFPGFLIAGHLNQHLIHSIYLIFHHSIFMAFFNLFSFRLYLQAPQSSTALYSCIFFLVLLSLVIFISIWLIRSPWSSIIFLITLLIILKQFF